MAPRRTAVALLLLASLAAAAAVDVASAAKPRSVAPVGHPDGFGHVPVHWDGGDRTVALLQRIHDLDDSLPTADFAVEKVGKNLSVLVQGKLWATHDTELLEIFRNLVGMAHLEQSGLVLDLSEVVHCSDELFAQVIAPALAEAAQNGVETMLLYNPLNRGINANAIKAIADKLDHVDSHDVTADVKA